MFAIVISEKGAGERRQVFDKDEIHIGRIQNNDLMLPKGNVSKRHATLSLHEGRFVVRDENSTNGTYVNRRRISQATIVREGDRIYVGDFILRLEMASAEELQKPSPEVSEPRSPAAAGLDFADKTVKTSGDVLLRPSAFPLKREPVARVEEPAAEDLASIPDASPGPAELMRGPAAEPIEAAPNYVGQLVNSVVQRLEPGLLDKELTETTVQRLARLLAEQAAVMERRGLLPATAVKEQVIAAARAELVGLGPLERLLADEQLDTVMASGNRELMAWGFHSGARHLAPFSSERALRWAISRLGRASGGSPLGPTDNRQLLNGWNLQVSLPEDDTSLVILRRLRPIALSLDDLVRRGDISRALAHFLQICVRSRRTLLIVAGPGSEPRDLLSALAAACQDDPLVFLEERPELLPDVHAIRVRPSDEAGLNAKLEMLGQLPGVRLVVPQFTGNGAWAVLGTISAGAAGSLLCVAGRSAEAALEMKVAELLVQARPPSGLAPGFVAARRWFASLADVSLEVGRLSDGRQRVTRVSQVIAGEETELVDLFRFVVERTAAGGSVEGTFQIVHADAPLIAEFVEQGLMPAPPSS